VPVSAQTRAVATAAVNGWLAAEVPVENPAALVPFFEQLLRQERGEGAGPLRILQFGDSHTAADEFTGTIRYLFQARFGVGGGGYSYAGKPWSSYRRVDVKSTGTRGWHSDGLVGRDGDGRYGLGGVSITTRTPREGVTIEADCTRAELLFLRQPGGGVVELMVDGDSAGELSTNGELGGGYFELRLEPGIHNLTVRTRDRSPVRLFGWVTENARGVTYETLGINGAQASILLNWDEKLTAEHLARRNPGLIVLAYGTNEAGNRDWTHESYRDMYLALIRRLRDAAPGASILVVGPPDRFARVRGKWTTYERIDMIVAAQREAALSAGCAFWDQREKMGGKGAMRQWVLAGLAQYDHVHFTAPGYRLLGDLMYRDMMTHYGTFVRVRDEVAQTTDGQTRPNHQDYLRGVEQGRSALSR
jgi:lysophospholipase L1-like esterase